MNITYISDQFATPIFNSQVLTLYNIHSKKFNMKLICFDDYRSMEHKRQQDVHLYKKYPFNFLPICIKFHASQIKKSIVDKTDIFHCRSQFSTLIAIYLKRKYKLKSKIIADIRGEVYQEFVESDTKWKFLKNYHLINDRKVLSEADCIFYVSLKMKEHYTNKFKLNKANTFIFPTIVNDTYFFQSQEYRSKLRNELNIKSDEICLAYVGGCNYWQNVDVILKEFVKKRALNSKYKLLFITNQEFEAKQILTDNNLSCDGIIFLNLEYKNVGSYLNVADAGIIIRNDSIINKVASPTKINEYSAVGLPIISKKSDFYEKIENLEKKPYKSLNEIIIEQQNVYNDLFIV